MPDEIDETQEMVRIVARICGAAIALIIVFYVFSHIFGTTREEFMTIAKDTLVTIASR